MCLRLPPLFHFGLSQIGKEFLSSEEFLHVLRALLCRAARILPIMVSVLNILHGASPLEKVKHRGNF